MSEENTGQGELDTTVGGITSAPTGQANEPLKAELAEATKQIERLKGTQSANDRALAAQKAENEKLLAKIAEYEDAVKARDESITLAQTELQDLKSVTAELDKLKSESEQAGKEIERLRVLAEYSAKSPLIPILVKANTLPQADNIEDFTKALDSIIADAGVATTNQVGSVLSGARKPPAPAGTEDADSMEQEGYRLIAQQRDEEGLKLIREAMALRMKE